MKRSSGQGRETRILLGRCGPVTRAEARKRIVSPKNISRWRRRYPGRVVRLHEWIPYEPAEGGIEGYLESGGYSALRKALRMKPREVVEAVAESQLLGRGGAGFPTGVKWRLAAAKTDGEKFFVCNAEEGEPGTFKDKVLLEQDPHQVLEGMVIGAYATGCRGAFIFIKGEYGTAAQRVSQAAQEAESKGLLGAAIGARVEATRFFSAGYLWEDNAWAGGLHNRAVGSWRESIVSWGILLGQHDEVRMVGVPKVSGDYGWFMGNDRGFRAAQPDNPLDLLSLRGTVALALGLDLELRVGEAIDFVLGIFTLDPSGDDRH